MTAPALIRKADVARMVAGVKAAGETIRKIEIDPMLADSIDYGYVST